MVIFHIQIESWIIFFLIIACHAIPLTEGRQLKSFRKQEDQHYEKGMKTQAKNTLNASQKHLTIADGFQVSPANARFPPQVATHIQEDGFSEVKAVTAFRPTTPGNSPGAGHSFTEHALNSASKAVSSVTDQPTAESGNGFRPTKPGNSPGAGHSIHNQIANP